MNAVPLTALCCHGIQSTSGDWASVENMLKGELEFTHAPRVLFDQKGIDAAEWENAVVSHESRMVREKCHNILIAHSFATHRAGRILQENPDLYGAILLNPPLNVMHSPVQHSHRNIAVPSDFMDLLFRNVAFDMTDGDYVHFIERQAESYATESREISRQGGILKKGSRFLERLEEIPSDKHVLVIQASGDPWNTDPITETSTRTVVDFGPECGHYPHVSRPKDVTALIRSWLYNKLLAIREEELEAVAFY